MKNIILEYSVSWKEILLDRESVDIATIPIGDLYENMAFTSLSILSLGRNPQFLYFEKVEIFKVLFDLTHYIGLLNKSPQSIYTLSSMNQLYMIEIEKKGKYLEINNILSKDAKPMSVNEVDFKNTLKQFKDRVFNDFLFFYPTLSAHPKISEIKKEFTYY
jgi:hypothetical protein